MLNVEEALQELSQKNYREIQSETAWKWASRSAACYQNCLNAEPKDKLSCWTLAEEYIHEAIEHAALSEGDPNLLKEIRYAIIPYQEKAAALMNPKEG